MMRALNNCGDATRESTVIRGVCESDPSVNHLLILSVSLRDLYRSASWQTTGIRSRGLRVLFDGHQEGQVRIVDTLLDLIEPQGYALVCQAQEGRFSTALCRRQSAIGLLLKLQSAHASILQSARMAEREDGGSSRRDVAICQLMLTNNLQRTSLADAVRRKAISDY
jgi:starvation-inducible DNA-binding protein